MPRGSAPGERRGGRAKGTPNRATSDLKALAQPYGAPAIAELARLGGLTAKAGAMHEATRVAALRELLDRGYGRSTQHVAGDADAGPVHYTFSWAPATPEPQPQAEVAPPVIDAAASIIDDTRPNAPLVLAWEAPESC
jgi:hypothetical protein